MNNTTRINVFRDPSEMSESERQKSCMDFFAAAYAKWEKEQEEKEAFAKVARQELRDIQPPPVVTHRTYKRRSNMMSDEEKAKLIKVWQSSKLKIGVFAKAAGIPYGTFYGILQREGLVGKHSKK